MSKLRRKLLYTLTLAILGTTFFTVWAELETRRSLPTTATPTAIPTLSPAAQQKCSPTPQEHSYGYLAEVAAISGERLTISGTVYASDATTPLPGALIEVWRADADEMNEPYPPALFGGRILTDRAGRYEFTTMKPVGQREPYLYYRITYQDACSVLMQLHLLADPQSGNASPENSLISTQLHPFSGQIKLTGPVLHNPVDIILPVLPAP